MDESHYGVADVLALLDAERNALLSALDAVPAGRRDERPGADRWSAAEVVEHLATVERGIAALLNKRGREVPLPDAAPAVPLDAARIAVLRGRVTRIQAPERVRPSGQITAGQALRALEEARGALRTAFLNADPAALEGCTHSHPVLGNLTLRDWVCFVAHHEARHAAQVREIAAALS